MTYDQDNPDLAEYFELGFGYALRVSKMIHHLPGEVKQLVPSYTQNDYIAPQLVDDGRPIVDIEPALAASGFYTMDEVRRVIAKYCTGHIVNKPQALILNPEWTGDTRQPSKIIKATGPGKGKYKRKPIKPFIQLPYKVRENMHGDGI